MEQHTGFRVFARLTYACVKYGDWLRGNIGSVVYKYEKIFTLNVSTLVNILSAILLYKTLIKHNNRYSETYFNNQLLEFIRNSLH